MRINGIYNYNNSSYKNTRFGTTEKINGNVRHVSWAMREENSLYHLVQLIINNKITNIVDCACSDASETYSLGIILNELVPNIEERNKFLPIIGYDIDPTIIDIARTRRINLTNDDIKMINLMTQNRCDNYFKKPEMPLYINNDIIAPLCKSYEVSPYLKFATQFRNADVLSVLSRLEDDGKTAFIFKNATVYLKKEYLDELLEMYNKKLKPNSLAAFGEYDNMSYIMSKLGGQFKVVGRNILKKMV